ncbi:MAG TPA: PaaI family thioesterase [Longimicrobiaceae bacterium]|nr:PaaI family thioesterase [Longimicrobiaceae bacterium]
MTASLPRLGPRDLEALLRSHLPALDMTVFRVEAVEPMFVRVRLRTGEQHLRPGDTISGPTLMTLADTAMLLVVLAMIGPEIATVTTSLNIHFLRRPAPSDLIAEARLLQLGKRLAVGEVTMYSEDEAAPVALATVTYAVPPA